MCGARSYLTVGVHLVTRIGVAVGCLMVLGATLRAALPGPVPGPGPVHERVVSSSEREPVSVKPVSVELPQRLTQRKGEWSPICAKTGQPLIDFSPVDQGQSLYRLVLTVHNCSAKTVLVRQPRLMLDRFTTLDTDGNAPKPIRLTPWQSAATVLSWSPTSDDPRGPSNRFEVHLANIGEGQLIDDALGEGMSQVRLTQWTRA